MKVKGDMVAACMAAVMSFCSPAASANSPLAADAKRRLAATELIVTGEKLRRRISETFSSVTVVTGDDATEQDLLSIYDVLDRIPNVVVDGNHTTFSIRGIDAFNVSGSGEGPLASVYVDGATLPRLALASGPLDIFDVAQVEIFRGSQSTIQGRNSLAGAVIINTADPGFDWTGKARLLLREQSGERRAALAVGGPLAGDQLAFRLAGETSQSDGLLRNVTIGQDADQRNSMAVRGKLLIKPTALPRLSILVGMVHDRHERGAFYSELDPPYPATGRIVTSDVQDVRRVASTIGTINARYEVGTGWALTAVGSLSRFRFRSVSDADRTAALGQISRIDEPTTSFQQELRLNFREPWIEGLVGAFYLRERKAYRFTADQSLSLSSLGVPGRLRSAGYPAAAVDAALALYSGAIPIQNSLSQPQLTKNVSAFTDMTFLLSHRAHLRVGLRYDREAQHRTAMQSVAIGQALPDPVFVSIPALSSIVTQLNATLQTLVAGANSTARPTELVYDAWLPLVGVSYDLNRALAISASVRRGYRAGGTGLNQQRGQSFSYGPEFTTNYELAIRTSLFDRRLTLNANLFWTEWKDQQVAIQLTPGSLYDTQIINAARSRIYGFELEGRAQIGSGLDTYAGIGLTNARFKKFLLDGGTEIASAAGKEFVRAPRWTITAGASYTDRRGPFASLNAHYRSAYYQTVADQSVRDIRARAIVDAKIGWKGRIVSAYVTASNIFNVQKPEQFFVDIDGRRRGALSNPRMLGIAVEGQI